MTYFAWADVSELRAIGSAFATGLADRISAYLDATEPLPNPSEGVL